MAYTNRYTKPPLQKWLVRMRHRVKYVVSMNNGKPFDRSAPLLSVLRDDLRVVRNTREFRKFIAMADLRVNGRVVKRPRARGFPVAIGDLIAVAGVNYRADLAGKRLTARTTNSTCVYRVLTGKTHLKGGVLQYNFNHGFNLIAKKLSGDLAPLSIGDPVKICTISGAAKRVSRTGAMALILKGERLGELVDFADFSRLQLPGLREIPHLIVEEEYAK